jgi:hypothetical protein
MMDRLRLFLTLAPTRAKDALFALACRMLLPLSTGCKVCNMLRGIAIGTLLGMLLSAVFGVLSSYFGWGY